MKIRAGTHRTVIISNRITIKFPRLLNLWKSLNCLFTKRREVFWFDLKLMVRTFLGGFRENLNEFSCWKENKADFLVPVYFSIGLIEIQRTVQLKEISEAEISQIWMSLMNLAREDVWSSSPHTLANRLNYRKDGNRYKLVDYGGHGLRQFIRKHRKELETILTPKI